MMPMSFGDALFYHPSRSVFGYPETYDLSYDSVSFGTDDGPRLHGWFFPARGVARGTLVHCHGNGGNITGHFETVRWLPDEGWNVFCFDYRGYGRSLGRPSRQGTIDDAHSALDYVRSRSDVDPNRVVVFGQSLGGAIGIVVAARSPWVRGIAVEGAFSNYRTEAEFVAKQNIFMRPVSGWLTQMVISDGLDPITVVGDIAPRPSFFICGTDDKIVDYRQTVALYEAAGEPKELWVIEGGGHTQATAEQEGRQKLAAFFKSCV
jgi:uncharacterized protein